MQKQLIILHEHNAMTDSPEIQLLGEDRSILLVIDDEDYDAMVVGGLNPYKYTDMIAYAFLLNPNEISKYSLSEFSVEWNDLHRAELQQSWDMGLEEFTKEQVN